MEEKDLNVIIVELSGIIAHYARVIRENTRLRGELAKLNYQEEASE